MTYESKGLNIDGSVRWSSIVAGDRARSTCQPYSQPSPSHQVGASYRVLWRGVPGQEECLGVETPPQVGSLCLNRTQSVSIQGIAISCHISIFRQHNSDTAGIPFP